MSALTREEARMKACEMIKEACRALEEMPKEDQQRVRVQSTLSELVCVWKSVRDINLDWE